MTKLLMLESMSLMRASFAGSDNIKFASARKAGIAVRIS